MFQEWKEVNSSNCDTREVYTGGVEVLWKRNAMQLVQQGRFMSTAGTLIDKLKILTYFLGVRLGLLGFH